LYRCERGGRAWRLLTASRAAGSVRAWTSKSGSSCWAATRRSRSWSSRPSRPGWLGGVIAMLKRGSCWAERSGRWGWRGSRSCPRARDGPMPSAASVRDDARRHIGFRAALPGWLRSASCVARRRQMATTAVRRLLRIGSSDGGRCGSAASASSAASEPIQYYQTSLPGRQSTAIGAARSSAGGVRGVLRTMMPPSSAADRSRRPSRWRIQVGPSQTSQPRRA
jgi:hypothetical protein